MCFGNRIYAINYQVYKSFDNRYNFEFSVRFYEMGDTKNLKLTQTFIGNLTIACQDSAHLKLVNERVMQDYFAKKAKYPIVQNIKIRS